MADQGDEWATPGGFDPSTQGDRRPATGPEAPPRYGERIPGWQPPAASAPVAPAATNDYVPPPKRGLFPLHPLGFGALLGAAFATIRWNPKATILPAIIVAVVQAGISYLLIFDVGAQALDRISRSTDSGRSAIEAGTIVEGVLLSVASLVVQLFGNALLQGIIVDVVARGGLGQRPTFGAVFRRARPAIPRLMLYALLLGVTITVGIGIIVALVAVAAIAGGVAGAIVAVLIGLVGGLGVVVLFVWISVKLALVPSALVLERLRLRSALARSWRLTRRSFWRTFGVIALVLVILYAAAQIISVPFSLIGGVVTALLSPNASIDPTTDPGGYLSMLALTSLPASIATTVVTGIGAIAQVAAAALVYLDLRMRREGLDIELQAVVESGAVESGTVESGAVASDPSGADPFRSPTRQWAPPTPPAPPTE